MKAWRIEATAARLFAIKQGKHIRNQRYGKAIRDARRKQRIEAGFPSPLLLALFGRHIQVYYGELETAFKAALAQLDREADPRPGDYNVYDDGEPVLANGLTEDETAATASVSGLTS